MTSAWVWAATATPVPVDSSKVEAGVIGLAFFVVMGLVVLALVLSMRRHLGRVDVTRHAAERARRAGGARAAATGEKVPQPPPGGPRPGGTV